MSFEQRCLSLGVVVDHFSHRKALRVVGVQQARRGPADPEFPYAFFQQLFCTSLFQEQGVTVAGVQDGEVRFP
ncbi:hypothetical protein [Kibdelosporangium phytohabitans]|uniref:Uncharacterized protein n=1 Tax=Kibdelosporangium phytohabitans TaxID=860235 RepID=A0A0N9I3Y7_9PSEU|nr:hypothetical protein [Kibdelosporangium phytohabitans]ALG10377.1 hypothetical protein AOZ06_28890 [Kibdelosporangium phytohabitans]MBE1461427.1 hypothetical protein [Kibdelosporangium phytohabitans]